MGDWLDELPLESETTDDVASEDEIPAGFDAALGDPWELTPLNSHAYRKALRQERRGATPPGLREGTDETQCGNCAHFDKGMCGLYTYRVKRDQVCNQWESAD